MAQVDVVITGLVETDEGGGVYQYVIDFTSQSGAADLATVVDRGVKLNLSSRLFDGTKFNYTYSDLTKTGRSFQRKLEIAKSGTTVAEPLVTDMFKEP